MLKVSVILTTYNSEKSIQRALDSLFGQEGLGTDFSLEIIIVDDMSTDNTRLIIEKNDLSCLTTGKNSGGPNKGRNIGLSIASGDFICVMDHDDEWIPDKIRAQLAFKGKAPIISSGYIEKDDRTGSTRVIVNPCPQTKGFNYYSENLTFLNHLIRSRKGQVAYIGGLMYQHSLKNVLFEEDYAMVDFDWFLRLFHYKSSVEVCKPLFIRHLAETNLSMNEIYRINDYKYSLKTLEEYKVEYPEPVRKSIKKINGTLARYYYKTEKMRNARQYFLKSGFNVKNLAYFLTTFYGYKIVNKLFKVF
jgi:glycosyltransferase involved in cell wall biosynthesis